MSTDQDEMTSFGRLRNMLLPVKESDFYIVKLFKNTIFYFFAIMLLVSTMVLFLAVLIAA